MTAAERHDRYWLGYRHGQRLAEHEPNVDHEPALRYEVKFAGRPGRAFALGELRGYRQAAGLPEPILEGHRLIADRTARLNALHTGTYAAGE